MKLCLATHIAAVMLFSACSSGSSLESPPAGETLVCFGDSLTAGYGASVAGADNKTKAYPAFLQNKITIPVVNSGVSGDTTADAKSRVKSDVIAKNPKIVIVELGANDLTQGISVNETKSNLESILTAVRNNNHPKIFLAKFYTESVVRAFLNSYGITDLILQNLFISQYDSIFSELAASYNAVLINDIWSGVWGVNMSDQFHPNAAGYEKMADNIFQAAKSYFTQLGIVK